MLKDPALLQTLGSRPNPAASKDAGAEGGEEGKEKLDSLLDEMK